MHGVTVASRTMTADELLQMPDDSYRYALVDGELRRMTPAGFRHGALVVRVMVPLAVHVKAHALGIVCGAETGFVLRRNPDTVLAPDVAFVRRERIPASGEPTTFWDGAPDLAVEVVSPGDTRREAAEKVAAWLSAGTRAVWVVSYRNTSITIHEPGRTPRRLTEKNTLDGAPLLPGFRLPVADIFKR